MRHGFHLAAAFLAFAGGAATIAPACAEALHMVPAPVADETPASPTEVAIFAGGCFWGVQGVFQHVTGVRSAVSGYAGGAQASAHYTEVGMGTTGHAESVRVTFDPKRVSYGRLLQIYFAVAHDPTELNRQGPDSGPQYRSTLFPVSAAQERVAKAYIAQLTAAKTFESAIVTTIEPHRAFYPAEAYHQDFLTLNPTNPYIAINDLPKIAALKQQFPAVYRDKPVLVGSGR